MKKPNILHFSSPEYESELKKRGLRGGRRYQTKGEEHSKVKELVEKILVQVAEGGDQALRELTQKFDEIRLEKLALTTAPTALGEETLHCLEYALKNIQDFARENIPKDWQIKNQEGAIVGERYSPFRRVGVYVPGGTAALISSALMTVGIASAAGVPEIVVTTPPPVHSTLHYALKLAGAHEIYQVGGAQAIAGLAYGTESIAPVDKIVGPGNAFVIEAKRQVVGEVSIDQLPGPSEIAVIADEKAIPRWVASDLLAQGEHGKGSGILLVTLCEDFLEELFQEIETQKEESERKEHIEGVLLSAKFVVAKNMDDAVKIVESYAPEHLSLAIEKAGSIAPKINNAGAIFIGNISPVAAGDYIAGPSHTLPTGGSARSFSGLTVGDFFKRTSLIQYSEAAIKRVSPLVSAIALQEGLDAHARSVKLRTE